MQISTFMLRYWSSYLLPKVSDDVEQFDDSIMVITQIIFQVTNAVIL